jgi:hypothetical protein
MALRGGYACSVGRQTRSASRRHPKASEMLRVTNLQAGVALKCKCLWGNTNSQDLNLESCITRRKHTDCVKGWKPRNRRSIPGTYKGFIFSPKRLEGYGNRPASYWMDTYCGLFLPGLKRPGYETDHSLYLVSRLIISGATPLHGFTLTFTLT